MGINAGEGDYECPASVVPGMCAFNNTGEVRRERTEACGAERQLCRVPRQGSAAGAQQLPRVAAAGSEGACKQAPLGQLPPAGLPLPLLLLLQAMLTCYVQRADKGCKSVVVYLGGLDGCSKSPLSVLKVRPDGASSWLAGRRGCCRGCCRAMALHASRP